MSTLTARISATDTPRTDVSKVPDADSPTILLVDDDDLNIAILEESLTDHYPNLLLARCGEKAIEMVERYRPALVLMDIMMPGITGYQACKAIKASPQAGEFTNVILVSAKASVAERVEGYEVGADDYLTKPFDESELLAKVRVQFRLRAALVEVSESRAAIARQNQKLERKVESQTRELTDTRDLVVFALAKLADSRDPETGAHLHRIRAYCQILCEHLAVHGPYTGVINDNFIQTIHLSSPLHDIGKVGIPDAVLLKPGRLTEDEFAIMAQHAVIGASALQEVASHGDSGGFLDMAIEIAAFHHEKWNGTGYPNKLVGEAIPLSARIVALADVFDALTSARVYKPAFMPTVAKSMITDESGKHFDPAIVEAFLANYDKFVAARDQFQGE